jgi:transcriptional regulator
MTRVDLLRSIGLDIDAAIAIDEEVSRLPPRTQRVFDMRAQGYTQQEIADVMGMWKTGVSYHNRKLHSILDLELYKTQNSVHYSSRG